MSNENPKRKLLIPLIALIVAIVVLLFGNNIVGRLFFATTAATDSGTVTVLVHGLTGKDELVLPSRGVVKLIYGDAIISKQINNEGEATFKQVPERFFQPDARVEILFQDPEREPYRAVHHDSLYQLTRGEYIALPVKLQGLGQIKGIVKDFVTGVAIPEVRVSVQGEDTFTNQFGEFVLQIPESKQRKYQSIRAFKLGYEPYEKADITPQTDEEVVIGLRLLK